MALNIIILAVEKNSNVGEFTNKIPLLMHSVSCLGGELNYTEIISTCDKERIKKRLICLSDKNENNIIILRGDTIVFPTLPDVAYEAIKEIISYDTQSDNPDTTISDLTEKLKHSFDRPICGIRKQTFILSMCGSYADTIKCLKANSTLILQIIYLMNMTEEFYNNNSDTLGDNNNSDALGGNNNSDASGGNNNSDASGGNNNSDASGGNNNSDASSDNNNSDASSDNNNPDTSCDPDKKSSLFSNDEVETFLVSMGICKKHKQSNMLSLIKAIDDTRIMLQESREKPLTEIVKTNDADGRILAEDIFSNVNVPSYSTSTKHGYAVLASAGKGVRRVLRADLAFAEISIEPDTCVRVRSGTPIPKGATAVVTLENTKIIEESDDENDDDYFKIYDKEYEIEVLIDPKEKANIRAAGCEMRRNQFILEKYLRIGPAELGILTLCGRDSVRVITVPSVGLLSIGDELVELGNLLTSGHIYDSNRITLISLLKKNGFDPVDLGISAYRVTDMLNKIEDALDKVDILVTMGHANDKDILKSILTKYFNAVFHFGRLDIKPGKSTAFASCKFNHKKKYFVCMSANPATVPIVAHLFLLPFLNEMYHNYFANITINLQSCVNTSYKLHSRPKFSWTNLQWTETEQFPRAKCLRNSQLQNMMRYSKANALLILPPCTMYQSTIDHAFLSTMFYG